MFRKRSRDERVARYSLDRAILTWFGGPHVVAYSFSWQTDRAVRHSRCFIHIANKSFSVGNGEAIEIGNNSPPVLGEQWVIGPRKASGLESFLYAEIPALGPTVVGQPAVPDSRSCL